MKQIRQCIVLGGARVFIFIYVQRSNPKRNENQPKNTASVRLSIVHCVWECVCLSFENGMPTGQIASLSLFAGYLQMNRIALVDCIGLFYSFFHSISAFFRLNDHRCPTESTRSNNRESKKPKHGQPSGHIASLLWPKIAFHQIN